MLNRRAALLALAGGSLVALRSNTFGQSSIEDEELLVPMDDSPSVGDLSAKHPFGSHPATRIEREKAALIIAQTPTGPRPIDIAQSFVSRFYESEPHTISEWPKSESWNPLIAHFFDGTTDRTEKDTVAWCAAFVNWCLDRSHRPSTKSSGSQSFALTKLFSATDNPVEGDIVVFTCYKPNTNDSYGIGHVTFFKQKIDGGHFLALGGNQGGKTRSIICEKPFPITFPSTRSLGSGRVPVEYRVNRYLHVA